MRTEERQSLRNQSERTRRDLIAAQNQLSADQRAASNVLRTMAAAVLVGGLCLGAMFALSGCEFVYLPECDTDCQAGGGNDSYGGSK
ncbi:MAG: hypothetical protein [Arizlama microvirus]|nr:MAG: hypothetical protein [Arizlama microvirus]